MELAKHYTFLDRLLHYAAFSLPGFQKVVASLEEDIYASRISKIDLGPELFVTGLPRSGTTLILELLHNTGEFCSFTYRQMPFPTAPIFWERISRPFLLAGESRERAHGDGVSISYDSPEALEEVVWLAYLSKKIIGNHVLNPLTASDIDEEFRLAFRSLIRRLASIHKDRSEPAKMRYLSKNNANFSRLSAIRSLCPDAVVLIPFRDPLTHVNSMINQHEKFSIDLANEKFVQRYIKWIGHYEFGVYFKPIDITGKLAKVQEKIKPDTAFWLNYWCDCYEHCLSSVQDKMFFVDYDALVSDAERSLKAVADCTGIADCDSFIQQHKTIRKPHSKSLCLDEINKPLRDRMHAIHSRMRDCAVNSSAGSLQQSSLHSPGCSGMQGEPL